MSVPAPARHFPSMLLCVPWHEGYFKVTLGLLSKHPPFSCPWILVPLCLYPRMIWSIAFDFLWFSRLCPKSDSVLFCQTQFSLPMGRQGRVFEVTLTTPAVTLSTVTCHPAPSLALREPRVCASPQPLRSGYLEIFLSKKYQTAQRSSSCGELI